MMRRVLNFAFGIAGTASALFALFATVLPAHSQQSHTWYVLIAVVLVATTSGCIIGRILLLKRDTDASHSKLKTCIDTIVSLLDSGYAIADRFKTTNDSDAIALEAFQWTDAVTAYLTKTLGKESAAEFRNAPPYTYTLPNHDFIGNSYWQHVEGKLRTLSYILNNVREHKLAVLGD